ncbi:MAG TPA: transcription antitermination factor NusB [Candidatus Dormibacteraeota bacterium]|nr:transcription antitermination factor NusB [Candidatus Dormibacteraeota bacterium]
MARKLALQALYRWQLNACAWQELVNEFADDPDMARADDAYFRALIQGVCSEREALDAELAPLLDRKPVELDPIERALLLIGAYELRHRPDVPYRVVINEAVGLARRFGATDGHKYVNGVLDRAARLWRTHEH